MTHGVGTDRVNGDEGNDLLYGDAANMLFSARGRERPPGTRRGRQ